MQTRGKGHSTIHWDQGAHIYGLAIENKNITKHKKQTQKKYFLHQSISYFDIYNLAGCSSWSSSSSSPIGPSHSVQHVRD